jgi:pyridoxamine 5'-phosphate oxidase family protein
MPELNASTETGVTLTDSERAYIQSQRLARIATVSPSGEVDVAAVVFRLDGDKFVVGGINQRATFKYRNVQRGSQVALVVDDLASTDPWRPRGVKVHGSASIVERPDGREVIVITPRRKWSWGLAK